MSDVRILHISDIHNNLRAARFVTKLSVEYGCDVVVDTGDLSGIGGWWEGCFLSLVPIPKCPLVFVPGNHDGPATMSAMRRRGAHVLDGLKVAEVAGLRFWGYPDPNRTKLLGNPYDSSACERGALEHPVPAGVDVVAVHNSKMVQDVGPDTALVLSGHSHKARVDRGVRPARINAGAAGGGRPFGRVFEAVLIDLSGGAINEITIVRRNMSG